MGGEAGFHNIENKLDGKASDGVGLKIGKTSTDKIGFLGATPVAQIAAPTGSLTDLTHVQTSATADYALLSLNNSSSADAWGFANKAEATGFVKTVSNLAARIVEVENVLSDFGLQA
jgi:hypothetical protein